MKVSVFWVKNKIVARAALEHKPNRVLDVGCGEGKIVNLLRRQGVDAWGIDSCQQEGYEFGKYAKEYCIKADVRKIPFEDNYFDVVVSNDFFEHISEEDIEAVYSEMKRVGKHIIARISLKPEVHHLTVKPIEWWKQKLIGCEFIGKEWNESKGN